MPVFFSVRQSTTYDSSTAFSCESPCSPQKSSYLCSPKTSNGLRDSTSAGLWRDLRGHGTPAKTGLSISWRTSGLQDLFLESLAKLKTSTVHLQPASTGSNEVCRTSEKKSKLFRFTVAKPVKVVTFALPNRIGHCFDNNIGLKINPHCYFKWK